MEANGGIPAEGDLGVTGPRTRQLLTHMAIVASVFLTLAPLTMAMPGDGLDPSWGLVIERAALEGWQWGRDIIFTFGPFGYHYQRIFHEDLTAQILVVSTVRTLLIGIGVALLVRGAGLWRGALAVAAVLISLPMTGDTAYLLLPFLVTLGHFNGRRPVPLWYAVAVAALCGLLVLIKTTFAVLALALLFVVDIDRLFSRRLPLLTPICLIASLLAYLSAGQSIAALPDFVGLSLEVASGFSQAMAVFSKLRAIELAAFLAASAGILILVLFIERRSGRLRTRAGLLMLLSLAAFWFVTYKAGFTRHDLHTLIAWSAFGVGTALYAATLAGGTAHRATRLLVLAGLVVAALAPARLAVAPGFGLGRVTVQTLFYNARDTIREAAAIVADPAAWVSEKQARRDAALAEIRARNPLPRLAGSIDTIPSIQGAVIAFGLDGGATYRPRPVIQEYSTYTAALIEANLAASESDRAPDTVLLAPGSIDNRYPTLAEGPLWPVLLRDYVPSGTIGPVRHLDQTIDVLVLHRRNGRDGLSAAPERTLTAHPEEPLALPDITGPVFATIDVRLSAAGRLLTLLHQMPEIEIIVILANGSAYTHRLVPEIARAGFVLSPYVDTTDAAARLFDRDQSRPSRRRVTEIQIHVPALTSWAFEGSIPVTLRPLR